MIRSRFFPGARSSDLALFCCANEPLAFFLTAWVKLVSSLEDGVETCGFFTGTQYSVIGTQDVIKPLFRVQGFGMSRVSRLPDGRYQNLHREVVFYLNLHGC